ncbi:Aurkc, partial [Symbiodinium sp. KB8]
SSAAFEASEPLGHGSFGKIYVGEDLSSPGLRRALKAVPCKRVEAAKEAEMEASLLAQWQHEHILRCYEWFYDGQGENSSVWMVLDLMDGGDLHSLFEQRRRTLAGPFDASFVRRVISAIGSALSFVHDQGFLHRDVKCANILLSRSAERIVLADFGLACAIGSQGEQETKEALGTPSYLPPEIACGGCHSPAADAWCLGVVSFKVAALRRPFEARDDTTLRMKIVRDEPNKLPQDTPADVAEAVKGLLHKIPEKRMLPAEAYAMTHESLIARPGSGSLGCWGCDRATRRVFWTAAGLV